MSQAKTYIVANFKMNLLLSESGQFLAQLNSIKEHRNSDFIQIIICPSFILLDTFVQSCSSKQIKIGAQNISHKKDGALTGEVSAAMIKDLGCSYAIIGHSERRHYFNESNHDIHEKLIRCFENNLAPILCIGETLEEHQSGMTHSVLEHQLKEALTHLPKESFHQLMIAYEPIWAIGSGHTPSLTEIEKTHLFIKESLLKYDFHSQCPPILYGGSVNITNANAIIETPHVSGVLIGKASLNAETILHIYQHCQ